MNKKTFTKKKKIICAVAIGVVLLLILGFLYIMFFTDVFNNVQPEADTTPEEESISIDDCLYEEKVFDTSYVHEINIQMDPEDFSELLEIADESIDYPAAVTIDGETVSDVSVCVKGNMTLKVAASNEDINRYSLKIKFDKYDKDQTYYGLDRLHLNNNLSDESYMEDYICFAMFRMMDVPAPLASYAMVSVNDEPYALLTALEGVDKSFMNRTLGSKGELYKPSYKYAGESEKEKVQETTEKATEGATEGTTEGATEGTTEGTTEGATEGTTERTTEGTTEEKTEETTVGGETADNKGTGDGGADEQQKSDNRTSTDSSVSQGGADLKYIDDDPDSYGGIFNTAITKISEKDKKKVVEALKALSEGRPEDAVDIDEVIGYFAVNNFTLNADGFLRRKAHNYYLYERGGLLSLIPWDYNGAFVLSDRIDKEFIQKFRKSDGEGSGSSGNGSSGRDNGEDQDATYYVNLGIDSPQGAAEDRPVWTFIANDEKYLNQYHDTVDRFITICFESGWFDTEFQRVYEMIRPYVESDPNRLITMEEFDEKVRYDQTICDLRAKSYRLQLEGKLATVSALQDESARVDASMLDE